MGTNFDTRFRDDSNGLVFMHRVDQDEDAVEVNLVSHGLSQTFRYDFSRTEIAKKSALTKKTSGFLAAVTPSKKRVIVAWAQSGHGIGGRGDALVPGDYVLENARWASEAIQLADILDFDLNSPFDKPSTPRGAFQASHVELKLATYAAKLLLRQKGHSRASTLTQKNLRQLRQARWSGSYAIHFEIYVSRKHCPRCQGFLRKLQELTGVQFDIRWGTRVVPIEYHQQQLVDATELARTEGDADKQRVPKLCTYEKDGVIHYIPPTEMARERRPQRRSPPELSDVDKPLPATAVMEDPYASSPTPEIIDLADECEGISACRERSPRPYGMQT